jgi:hypothetical protein
MDVSSFLHTCFTTIKSFLLRHILAQTRSEIIDTVLVLTSPLLWLLNPEDYSNMIFWTIPNHTHNNSVTSLRLLWEAQTLHLPGCFFAMNISLVYSQEIYKMPHVTHYNIKLVAWPKFCMASEWLFNSHRYSNTVHLFLNFTEVSIQHICMNDTINIPTTWINK